MEKVAESRKVGRPRGNFDSCQGSKIIELLKEGHGRKTACLMTKVSYKSLLHKLKTDAEFAEQVALVEASRTEECEALLYRFVSKPCDFPLKLRAAVAYLGRRDRAEALRKANRVAKEAKEEKEAKPRKGKGGTEV